MGMWRWTSSCDPVLVKEVDALGGAMAVATDRAGIQFRTLNARKGPAVRATRAQADRVLYKNAIRKILESQANLCIFQQPVDDLIIEGGRVAGAVTQMGLRFTAPRVILTTGTFLGGKIHIGLENSSGGRAGDPPSIALAHRLREMPFRVERLKTGTPPRIDARSVNFKPLEEQWGDTPTPVMSFMGSAQDHPEQRCCWISYTNENTHDIVRGGLDRSPMYSGVSSSAPVPPYSNSWATTFRCADWADWPRAHSSSAGPCLEWMWSGRLRRSRCSLPSL